MPPSPPGPPIAHICAPRFPHEPIDIIGNEPGLGRLINVLIDAVGEGRAKARSPRAIAATRRSVPSASGANDGRRNGGERGRPAGKWTIR
jgi:hypothetical protein